MSTPDRAAQHETVHRTDPGRPAPVVAPAGDEGERDERAFGAGDLTDQAARLGDARLSTIQRQSMALRVGQVQGNQHLQRMVASLGRGGGTAAVQREYGPSTITEAPQGTVIKVCLFRIAGPSGAYMRDVSQYLINTLRVPEADLIWVDSLGHLFASLAALRGGPQVNRLIIVSHGRTADDRNTTSADEGQVRQEGGWITVDDVRGAAGTPQAQVVRNQVLAPGAIVEFWGCRLGRSEGAMADWSRAMLPGAGAPVGTPRAEFRAPTERLEVNAPEFGWQEGRGSQAHWVRVTRADQMPERRRAEFRRLLLIMYPHMVENREIVETTPPRTEAQQFEYMTGLFDRSGGQIRTMALNTESSGAVAPRHAPWPSFWLTHRLNPADLFE